MVTAKIKTKCCPCDKLSSFCMLPAYQAQRDELHFLCNIGARTVVLPFSQSQSHRQSGSYDRNS